MPSVIIAVITLYSAIKYCYLKIPASVSSKYAETVKLHAEQVFIKLDQDPFLLYFQKI